MAITHNRPDPKQDGYEGEKRKMEVWIQQDLEKKPQKPKKTSKSRLSQFKPYKCSSCGSPTRALQKTDRYVERLCIICFIKGSGV